MKGSCPTISLNKLLSLFVTSFHQSCSWLPLNCSHSLTLLLISFSPLLLSIKAFKIDAKQAVTNTMNCQDLYRNYQTSSKFKYIVSLCACFFKNIFPIYQIQRFNLLTIIHIEGRCHCRPVGRHLLPILILKWMLHGTGTKIGKTHSKVCNTSADTAFNTLLLLYDQLSYINPTKSRENYQNSDFHVAPSEVASLRLNIGSDRKLWKTPNLYK